MGTWVWRPVRLKSSSMKSSVTSAKYSWPRQEQKLEIQDSGVPEEVDMVGEAVRGAERAEVEGSLGEGICKPPRRADRWSSTWGDTVVVELAGFGEWCVVSKCRAIPDVPDSVVVRIEESALLNGPCRWTVNETGAIFEVGGNDGCAQSGRRNAGRVLIPVITSEARSSCGCSADQRFLRLLCLGALDDQSYLERQGRRFMAERESATCD